MIAALSCLHAAGVACSGEFAIERDPLAEMPVETLLQSLTFDDFEHRESVARQLATRDWRDAAKLVHIARNETSPLRPRARYMLRRTFRELAPKVAAQATGDDPQVRGEARGAFEAMVDVDPLDAHHHGGLQKLAIVFEELGLYESALNAYRAWEPPQTFCGTCTAEIRAERVEGIVRCLGELNRFDEAARLCWDELRNDGFGPTVPFGVALVEIYDAQGRLDGLAAELARVDEKQEGVQAAREYLEILQSFRAGKYDHVLPHLTGGRLGDLDWFLKTGRGRYWKPLAVAEAFGSLGDDAVPLLGEHLSERTVYDACWTVYALKQTASPKAVEPVMDWVERNADILPLHSSGQISELLHRFPEASMPRLIPLLKDRELAHGAIRQLSGMATEAAVERLIENFYGGISGSEGGERSKLLQAGYAEHSVWALWRLTGESLGMDRWSGERLLEEGQREWQRWWAGRPAGFKLRSPRWWRSPDAAPKLIEALNSPATRFRTSAGSDLLELEHPILVRALDPSDPLFAGHPTTWPMSPSRVARMWLRFDTAAAIPVLIQHWDGRGSDLREAVSPILYPLMNEHEAARRAYRDLDSKAAWRAWWEDNKDKLQPMPQERWW